MGQADPLLADRQVTERKHDPTEGRRPYRLNGARRETSRR